MPEAEVKTVWQDQQCKFEVPADSCRVEWGYKDRDRIVFDWRGDHFFLCDDRKSRYDNGIIAVDVPLIVLAEHWPQFIKFLQAKVAEAAGPQGGEL